LFWPHPGDAKPLLHRHQLDAAAFASCYCKQLLMAQNYVLCKLCQLL
jgi:hypothetical protein